LETDERMEFAGFWRRFVAFIIDAIIVSLIVFPFALAIGLASPNLLLVEVPFGLFTTSEVVREISEDTEEHSDGSTSVVQRHIEREEVLGLWVNHYEVQTTRSKGETETEKQLVDPDTLREITRTTSGDIEFYVIFIYWILLEASRLQGSIGKKMMGIKVVTLGGGKPNIYQAAARNLLKVLSGITLFIGFMMAGWTAKKQALHDKIPDMLVVKESASEAA
jgi:uncharacterized RDD family membrane protein YckC